MGKFQETRNRFMKEMQATGKDPEEVSRQNLANQIIMDQLFHFNSDDVFKFVLRFIK